MGSGVWLRHAFGVNVSSCLIKDNQLNGLGAEDSGLAIYSSIFDGNARTGTWTRNDNPNEGQVRLERCEVARVDACQFLNIQEGVVQRGCVIVDSGGAMIGACYLEASSSGDRYGIVIRGTEGPIVILSNRFKNVDTLVKVDATVPDCMVSPQGEVGSSVGVMDLPDPNMGMFGGAQIRKPATNVLTGLIIPSGPDDPTENLQNGMLAYNTTGQALRVFYAGAWRTVEVT